MEVLNNETMEAATTAVPEEGVEDSEALAILTQMCLIILVFVVGWLLKKRHISFISEASVGLIVGIAAGGVAFVYTHRFDASAYSDWMNFSPDFFFFALLRKCPLPLPSVPAHERRPPRPFQCCR